jgi:hypothetical protein
MCVWVDNQMKHVGVHLVTDGEKSDKAGIVLVIHHGQRRASPDCARIDVVELRGVAGISRGAVCVSNPGT